MRIIVTRQACCAPDDQLGPLRIDLDLSKTATVQELARLIGESGFLQFSGTRNVMSICSDGLKLLNIPSLGIEGCSVECFVNKLKPASNYIKSGIVECKWSEDL